MRQRRARTSSSFALKLRRLAENDAVSDTFDMISLRPEDILIGRELSLISFESNNEAEGHSRISQSDSSVLTGTILVLFVDYESRASNRDAALLPVPPTGRRERGWIRFEFEQRPCTRNTHITTSDLQFLLRRSLDSHAVLLDEVLERLERSVALVIHLASAVTAGLEELQRGEATNIDSLHLVGGSVDLGDEDLLVVASSS